MLKAICGEVAVISWHGDSEGTNTTPSVTDPRRRERATVPAANNRIRSTTTVIEGIIIYLVPAKYVVCTERIQRAKNRYVNDRMTLSVVRTDGDER